MQNWLCGVMLAGATAGGVAFVFTGVGSTSHCGPCLAVSPSDVPGEAASAEPVGAPVTDVVDLVAALTAPPAPPRQEPFVSFEEPPLARPPADPRAPKEMPGPGVIQATFLVDGPIPELAPMPRVTPPAPASRFSRPTDPF